MESAGSAVFVGRNVEGILTYSTHKFGTRSGKLI